MTSECVGMNKMLSFPWPTLLQVQVSTSRTSLDPMPRAPPQSARRCIHVLVHVWKAQDSIHRLIRTRCFRECIQNWGSHKHFRFTKMKFTCELCKHNFRIIIKVVMFFLLIIVSRCSKQMTSCIIVHRIYSVWSNPTQSNMASIHRTSMWILSTLCTGVFRWNWLDLCSGYRWADTVILMAALQTHWWTLSPACF